MKFCILKPLIWNTENYTKASGVGAEAANNFIYDFGYGHEEWNNSPDMCLNGSRYFHSEFEQSIIDKANEDELAIIMIASHEGSQYVVGVAAGVRANAENDMPRIAKELKVYDKWKEIWQLPIVQDKFKNKKSSFIKHWKQHYWWIAWSCPEKLFYWFNEPFTINPLKITGKKRFVTMFKKHQYIAPEQAVHILAEHIDHDHPIMEWLVEGEFDPGSTPPLVKSTKLYKKIREEIHNSGRNSPSKMIYEYWIEGKRKVYPRHYALQTAFANSLKSRNIKFEQDINDYIDMKYLEKGDPVLVEIKPAEIVGTKYAIRAAIGQLLEYRHTSQEYNAKLHIVLDIKPSEKEIDFVKSLANLGFMLSYKTEDETFHQIC